MSRRLRIEGDGVSIEAAALPFLTGVDPRDAASASPTVEGRVGSCALETSGHASGSQALCRRTSVRLARCAREGIAAVMCEVKAARSEERMQPWLTLRRMEGDTEGWANCWPPLTGVQGATLLLSVFLEACVQPSRSPSVGGVLAELVMERRVEERPRTGEGVRALVVAAMGDGGVTAGSLKRTDRSRSLTDAEPAARLDIACGTQQRCMEFPSNALSWRRWSTCMHKPARCCERWAACGARWAEGVDCQATAP